MSAIGHFGNAEVIFAFPGQRIPAELQIEFELLRQTEKEPALLRDWIARLQRRLVVAARPQPWSILRVAAGMERKVAGALGPKTLENPHGVGLQVYVPLEKYRPANNWRTRMRPLLPGYIFAELRDDDDLDLARGNHAVRDVMCVGGRPVRVRAIDIGALVLFEAFRAFDCTAKTSSSRPRNRRGNKSKAEPSRWKSGQRVTIGEGAFAGFVGTIMNAPRDDRLEVLISLFGRETPLVLDETMLEGWDQE